LLATVVLFAVAMVLGIDTDADRGLSMVWDGLRGEGRVKSDGWLLIARVSLVVIVIQVIGLKIQQNAFLKERLERETHDSPKN